MTTNRPSGIPTRRIPALQRDTAPIGLGCMGMSWAYVDPADRDEEAGIAVVRGALDRGITLLDTSDAYAAGHNETLVGRAIAGRRESAIVATKGGLVGEYVDGAARITGRDGTPAHLRAAVDASLGRLGIEQIDLYYLHRVDPRVPLEESWGTLADLMAVGKLRALGLSEVSTEQAALAHALHPVAAIQSELSLWSRDPLGGGTTADGDAAGDVVSWTRENGAVFVPFSPLGRGFLTGELAAQGVGTTDFRASLPRFTGEAGRSNLRIVDAVRTVAARHEVTAAAVALAWVLSRGDHVIPIPGTTKLHRLDENLAAAGVGLTPEDLAELDALPAAEGTRY